MTTAPFSEPPGPLFGSAETSALFTDHARLQGMLDFEAALAQAETKTAVIPASAGRVIATKCRAELFDIAELARATAHLSPADFDRPFEPRNYVGIAATFVARLHAEAYRRVRAVDVELRAVTAARPERTATILLSALPPWPSKGSVREDLSGFDRRSVRQSVRWSR